MANLKLVYSRKTKSITAADQSTSDVLSNGYLGKSVDGKLRLDIIEAMYLMDVRAAECIVEEGGESISFSQLCSEFAASKKFMAKYFTFKDWRERGLIAKTPDSIEIKPHKHKDPAKKYPTSKFKPPSKKASGTFFQDDLITIVSDPEAGEDLYRRFWLGQYGNYKASSRGSLNKLDAYETVFLTDLGVLQIEGLSSKDIVRISSARRRDFSKLYAVYLDWRSKGYVVKTGFKFGANFRIYFPGALPDDKSNEWFHSKHVLHVFPRDSKLLTSEWARAIRVAHSVRKTFILAIPGRSRKKKLPINFYLFHRKGTSTENPSNAQPSLAMLSLSEEEYIGGSELSSVIRQSSESGCELVIAIADRETAVTYYKVKGVELPGSSYEYYEIDWIQP